jgi:DNA-binding transcriptional MerR regulator
MAGKKTAVYFRIGEAARMLGISPASLRNWERMGLIAPARSRGRYRLYSREALKKLRKIQYLRTVQGVNPAGIAAILQGKQYNQREPSATKHKQEAIAQKLRELRREHGLTLAEVAQKTGVSVSFLSSLKRGYSNASIATLQKLARLYETNVLAFFCERGWFEPAGARATAEGPGAQPRRTNGTAGLWQKGYGTASLPDRSRCRQWRLLQP